jgi:hypothetical protein
MTSATVSYHPQPGSHRAAPTGRPAAHLTSSTAGLTRHGPTDTRRLVRPPAAVVRSRPRLPWQRKSRQRGDSSRDRSATNASAGATTARRSEAPTGKQSGRSHDATAVWRGMRCSLRTGAATLAIRTSAVRLCNRATRTARTIRWLSAPCLDPPASTLTLARGSRRRPRRPHRCRVGTPLALKQAIPGVRGGFTGRERLDEA